MLHSVVKHGTESRTSTALFPWFILVPQYPTEQYTNHESTGTVCDGIIVLTCHVLWLMMFKVIITFTKIHCTSKVLVMSQCHKTIARLTTSTVVVLVEMYRESWLARLFNFCNDAFPVQLSDGPAQPICNFGVGGTYSW